MMYKFAIFALGLLMAGPAWALDSTQIDAGIKITTVAAIQTTRQALINQIWGISTGVLPTTVATVTASTIPAKFQSGCTAPCWPMNISHVDQFVDHINGSSNPAFLFYANSPNNHRLVLMNGGHQADCFWDTMDTSYNLQLVMQHLLAHGYSVLGTSMPACGNAGTHINMYTGWNSGGVANPASWTYEMEVEALNYLDQQNPRFLDYNMIGLSGGGFTTDTYAALDPRLHVIVPVAGSMPGVQFVNQVWPIANSNQYPANYGDCPYGAQPNCFAEQSYIPQYQIAGFLDHYVLATYGLSPTGAPRIRQQILNVHDSCCFGPTTWSASPALAWYSAGGAGQALCGNPPNYTANCDWGTYLAFYSGQLTNTIVSLGGLASQAKPTVQDPVSVKHQITNCDNSTSNNWSNCVGGGGPPGNATAVGGYASATDLIQATLDLNPPFQPPSTVAGGGRGMFGRSR